MRPIPFQPRFEVLENRCLLSTGANLNQVSGLGAGELSETMTKVLTSAHPSAPNQNVSIVAYVSAAAPGSNIPTGTVTFYDNGQSFAILPLRNGSVFTPRVFATAGTHILTAYYNGNDQFLPSTSDPFDQVVRSRTFFAASVSVDLFDSRERLVHIFGMDGRPLYQIVTPNIYGEGRSVAVGSLTSDQYDDLVVSDGYLSSISIYRGRGIADGTFNPDTDQLYSFSLYPGFQPNKGGTVAIGDVNGDGYPDLIVADRAGPFGFDGARVWVFDGRAFATGTFDAQNPQASVSGEPMTNSTGPGITTAPRGPWRRGRTPRRMDLPGRPVDGGKSGGHPEQLRRDQAGEAIAAVGSVVGAVQIGRR